MCHRKEAERQNILRRIQAAGCPIEVDLPRVDTRNELSIMQAGEAYLFDLGTAGSALALWMRLALQRRARSRSWSSAMYTFPGAHCRRHGWTRYRGQVRRSTGFRTDLISLAILS